MPLAGEALALRAARSLAVATGRVGVVASDAVLVEVLGIPGRVDAGKGPVSGLQAALAWAEEEGRGGALVLACDFPLVTPALLAALRAEGAEGGEGDRSRPLLPESRGPLGLEPLAAYYPVSARPTVEAVLVGGEPSMRRLLEALPPRRLALARVADFGPPERLFLNVNDPAARDHAERLVMGRNQQSDHNMPVLLGIVGWKDSGKTSLVVALGAELTRRGRRVMTIKHGHGFELDRPGADSWRHRHEGGASRVVLAGPADFAVAGEWGPGGDPGPGELARRYLGDAEIVLVEGYKRAELPRVEVYRKGGSEAPLEGDCYGWGPSLAVVTDRHDLVAPVPVLRSDDPGHVERLADLVESRVLGARGE